MKKIILFIGCALLASTLNAETLMWSADGEDAYKELDWRAWYSRSRFQTNDYNKKIQLVALKNSSRVKDAFSDFTVRRVKGESPSGKTVKVSTIGTESCQCVAFVKAMTGSTVRSTDWEAGESLLDMKTIDSKLRNLAMGTVIATFDSNGDYNYGHTAIVVGKSGTGDWIEVIDQNWSPVVDTNFATREESIGTYSPECTKNGLHYYFQNSDKKGFVMTHRIYFDEPNSLYFTQRAEKYNIVDVN